METLASFRLRGSEELTAQAVTTRLSLTPSRSAELGDLVGSRSSRVHDTSLWLLASAPHIEDGVELSEQLDRLLVVLEPVESAIWDLVHQGYWANWFCYVASNPSEHAVELDRALLTRLLRLPGDLWIDACGDNT